MKFNADEETVERRIGYLRAAWEQLAFLFNSPEPEVRLEGLLVAGTADLISDDCENGVVRILDWKSGRKQKDYWAQLLGYALAYSQCREMPANGFELYVVWLEHCEWEYRYVSPDDVHGFEAVLRDILGESNVYSPGESCTYCPRQNECPAREQYIRSSANALVDLGETSITAERLVEMYPRVQALEAACENYRSALRVLLARGAIPTGDGKVMRLGERHRRRIVDVDAANTVLTKHGLRGNEIRSCLTMSVTDASRLVLEHATGVKTHAKKALFDDLERAGAIAESTYTQIETVRGDS